MENIYQRSLRVSCLSIATFEILLVCACLMVTLYTENTSLLYQEAIVCDISRYQLQIEHMFHVVLNHILQLHFFYISIMLLNFNMHLQQPMTHWSRTHHPLLHPVKHQSEIR